MLTSYWQHFKSGTDIRGVALDGVEAPPLALTAEVVEKLAYEYGWSESVPNLSGKLRRGSLRYSEAVELADALGYDIVWQKRKRN